MKTYGVSDDAMLDVLRELPLISFFIIVHQLAHVVSHMQAHDVFTVDFSIEFLGFGIVSRESLGAVRYVDATIGGSLHGTEDSGTGCSAGQTNIQESTEGTRSLFNILNIVNSSSYVSASLIDGVELELLQQLRNKY